MPFPNHVVVSLQNEKGFSCPPQEFREKMIAEMKFFFGGKLESDIKCVWGDLERLLWYSVQRVPLFMQEGMMVQLKEQKEDKEEGFKVFLTKQPNVWPKWELFEESDDEDSEANMPVFFAMEVTIKVVLMDTLKKKSALIVGGKGLEVQLPRILNSFVSNLSSDDFSPNFKCV